MKPILISHPQHGQMHVYSETDLARHEALGWRRKEEVKKEPPARAAPMSAAELRKLKR